MTIKQLRAAITAKEAEIKAMLEGDEDSGGTMTATALEEVEAAQEELDRMRQTLRVRERFAQHETEMSESTGRNAPVEEPGSLAPGDVVVGADRSAETGGFRDLAEVANAVLQAHPQVGGTVDDRLVVRGTPGAAHLEAIGEDGGFLVPAAFRNEIWDKVWSDNGLLGRFNFEPTNSNVVMVTKDETTPWGSTGITAAWAAEKAQLTADKMTLKQNQLSLHKLFCFLLASDELLSDAPRLANRLAAGAARAIRWKLMDSIIYGTGAGQPYGYFASPALATVTKESGQSADTIVAANVLKMLASLIISDDSMPIWIANNDTLPQLGTMTVGDQPAFIPNNQGITGGLAGFLLGYPIFWSQHAKTLGDKGDIQLVDPMGYYAAQKTGGIRAASSMHLYFDYDLTAFRWTIRVAGQPFLSSTITPNNGSLSRSHFVVLEART